MKKDSRKQAGSGEKIQRAAVLGAGIMGGGIAFTAAQSGIPVLLKDIAQDALDRGVTEARTLLDKQVASGRLAPARAETILSSIAPTLSFDAFDSVGIVVEAIVENLDIKRRAFAELEKLVKPGTVLASNTSSLLIADIAAALQHPENMVGMHFFNPVPLMPLVEIIRGPATSDQAIATAVGYVSAIGKTPLVVKDCPGFLVNRLLGAYMMAFLQLVHEGASFEDIDRVMESWGWPMGPAYLMDVAGIDTLDKALAILAKAYPDVMGPPWRTAIQLLASEKRYGQKTSAGFYAYAPDAKGRVRRHVDPEIHTLLAAVQPTGRKPFDDQEIEDRLMLAMILEAARCLEENIVASAAEIDVAMRLATGFPAHHGGPLWYADTLGLAEVKRRCDGYAALGGLFAGNPLIDQLIAGGRGFYG
jgi:3-hydroxyacyl-CoA dehydrogenase/enoyl-CoA hydratase/3-hydroxybutyryl-CoA epimerase/enoyl-CoA isomerase